VYIATPYCLIPGIWIVFSSYFETLTAIFPFDKNDAFWYSIPMKKKSLLETNPYLKDPVKREAAIVINVATSSAIEGVSMSAFSGLPAAKKQTGKTRFATARSSRSPRRKSSPLVRNSD
jgi:hypothetical protein